MQSTDQNILAYLSHLNHYVWEHRLDQTLEYQIRFERGCLIVCVEHLAFADQCVGSSRLLLGANVHLKVILKPSQRIIFELIP